MTSPTQDTVSQSGEEVSLQVFVPFELKDRLRQIAFDRRTTYRELVIQAVEKTYPEEDRKKRSA